MTTFRRKPMTVQAIQWTLDNYETIVAFTDSNVALTADNTCIVINGQTVCEGDWIVKFTGQATSSGPTVDRYSVMTNDTFTSQFEPIPA